MSLSVGRTKLLEAQKLLLMRWDAVCRQWDDPKRHEFQKEFIDGLDADIRSAINAIENMNGLVSRARSECADQGGFWS
ncbi:MAG: hypothetical protein AAF432_04160 [Planctomycetota bacterium]